MRQNDRRPYLLATLSDANGAVNLTGETVRFVMRSSDGTVKIDQSSTGSALSVIDSTGGRVRYKWQAGDLDTPAVFLAEFQLMNASTEAETFPNKGHITVLVTHELSTN